MSSLAYLHNHNIIHRDLKPENIIFKDTTTDVIKLIDFGLSLKASKEEVLKERMGTVNIKNIFNNLFLALLYSSWNSIWKLQ